jgi:hypothetical protein
MLPVWGLIPELLRVVVELVPVPAVVLVALRLPVVVLGMVVQVALAVVRLREQQGLLMMFLQIHL